MYLPVQDVQHCVELLLPHIGIGNSAQLDEGTEQQDLDAIILLQGRLEPVLHRLPKSCALDK